MINSNTNLMPKEYEPDEIVEQEAANSDEAIDALLDKPAKKPIKAGHISLLLLLVIVVWIASGVLTREAPVSTVSKPVTTAVPISVRTMISEASAKTQFIQLYGVTEASSKVDLMAETSGTIKQIIAKEGQRIKAGELILEIDIRNREMVLKRAEALVKQRELEYEAAKSLGQKGYSSETKVAEAAALLVAAKSDLEAAKLDISFTTVRSPINGILDTIHVDVGDFVNPNDIGGGGNQGSGLATIIDTDPFLVVGQISEKHIDKVEEGSTVNVRLINDNQYDGTIRFISAVADPNTRTFRTEIEIIDEKLAEGMTAEIFIPVNDTIAHKIPSSALTLNDEGVLGVKLVEDADGKTIARFYPVSILSEDAEGMWVKDLPQSIQLITIGQGFVKDSGPILISE